MTDKIATLNTTTATDASTDASAKQEERTPLLMSKERKKILKDLYMLRSYSGFEEPTRRYIQIFLEKLKIPYINYNGNILGLNHPGAPLFSAHMDMVNTEGYKLKSTEYMINPAYFTLDSQTNIRLYRDPEHKEQTSLGADDKNGIWVILNLLKDKKKLNFAFCHSEEVGGIGSSQIVRDAELAKFIEKCQYGIIIDRRNKGDIIGYDNEYCMALDDKLQSFAKDNGFDFSTARGSISDADKFSMLIECVNLSCGYYCPHTSNEYTNLNELYTTYKLCSKLLTDFKYESVSPERIRDFKSCKKIPYVDEEKEKEKEKEKDKKVNSVSGWSNGYNDYNYSEWYKNYAEKKRYNN